MRILRRITQAIVKIPSDEEIESFKAAISVRHPALHDAFFVADGLKLRLEQCVVHFASSRARHPFLVKSSNAPTGPNDDKLLLETRRQATLARQSAESGMRALQVCFPFLRKRLSYAERGERKLILVSIIYFLIIGQQLLV